MCLVTLKTNCTDDSAKRIKTVSHTLLSVPVSDCEYNEFQYLKESQRPQPQPCAEMLGGLGVMTTTYLLYVLIIYTLCIVALYGLPLLV